MSKKRKIQQLKCIITDYVASMIAWAAFFFLRKSTEIDANTNLFSTVVNDHTFWTGVLLIPLFWIVIYILVDDYRKPFRKSRIQEIGKSTIVVLIGSVILFFLVILDDNVVDYRGYYKYFFQLFMCQFVMTITSRLIVTSITLKRIREKKEGFKTLMVGSNGNAINTYRELNKKNNLSGNLFVGFVNVGEYEHYSLDKELAHLGDYNDIPKLIKEYDIEEVIIAIEQSEMSIVQSIIAILEDADVIIKIKPLVQDILLGAVKTSGIFNVPMIEITPTPMPIWQQVIKRFIDILISMLAIIIGLPVYIFAAICVHKSSPGPIFYSQERIGIHGKPFKMLKFRSMYVDAENNGPQLSSKDDPRITPWGKIMRKYRIDELPQFFTVIIGKMSLVGPRPERQYYIDQITQRAPYYRLLLRIKPGITSWGQVKYGYAENVDEMIERLPYDLLYIENMSLAMDLKILIYTVKIVFEGRGE